MSLKPGMFYTVLNHINTRPVTQSERDHAAAGSEASCRAHAFAPSIFPKAQNLIAALRSYIWFSSLPDIWPRPKIEQTCKWISHPRILICTGTGVTL